MKGTLGSYGIISECVSDELDRIDEEIEALKSENSSLKAELAELKAAQEWMPIGEAPFDKWILVGYYNQYGEWFTGRVLRSKEPTLVGEYWGANGDGTRYTHFMPLPNPPKGNEDA